MNIDDNDAIAACELYRGWPIFDQQSPARIREVRRELDLVHATSSVAALFEWCANTRNSPESRLFSLAKLRCLPFKPPMRGSPLGLTCNSPKRRAPALGFGGGGTLVGTQVCWTCRGQDCARRRCWRTTNDGRRSFAPPVEGRSVAEPTDPSAVDRLAAVRDARLVPRRGRALDWLRRQTGGPFVTCRR